MDGQRGAPFLHRYLDPESTVGELIFGLIMTLTFTSGAGILIEDEGPAGARELLIALIGCNLAWGIIDAAFYLVGRLFERNRRRHLTEAVRGAVDDRIAMTVVASELGPSIENVTSEQAREALYANVVTNLRATTERPASTTKADLLGAFVSFCWVALPSIPAALPFLLIDQARFALRVSNAILLAILFVTGYMCARRTFRQPWLVGFGFLFSGIVLVAVAIALGG